MKYPAFVMALATLGIFGDFASGIAQPSVTKPMAKAPGIIGNVALKTPSGQPLTPRQCELLGGTINYNKSCGGTRLVCWSGVKKGGVTQGVCISNLD